MNLKKRSREQQLEYVLREVACIIESTAMTATGTVTIEKLKKIDKNLQKMYLIIANVLSLKVKE